MIRLRALTKRYPNGTVAVDHLDLDVPDGEVLVLVGPSGCGKTTTLRMVNRLIEPTSGTIEVSGRDVMAMDPVELRRHVGYVIQHVGLFPHHTVAGNVATVPKLLGWNRTRTRERVDELLTLVGLDPATYRDRYPAQLSGGQQQRVGVARALAADPPVLLMDEPFGAIDPITRVRLQQEFATLQARLRKTVVLVTHDIDEAVLLADRMAILREGGVLEQVGAPSEVLGQPATDFVASFVGLDRGLKRLTVTPVDPAIVRPLPAAGLPLGTPAVRAGASVREALAQALLGPSGEVGVLDSGGRLTGVVALADLVQAARLDTTEPPGPDRPEAGGEAATGEPAQA